MTAYFTSNGTLTQAHIPGASSKESRKGVESDCLCSQAKPPSVAPLLPNLHIHIRSFIRLLLLQLLYSRDFPIAN